MPPNRVFQIALIVSALTHGVILFQNSHFVLFNNNKKNQKLEVSYIEKKELPKEPEKLSLAKKEPFFEIPSKITARKRPPPPFVDRGGLLEKKIALNSPNPSFNKPQAAKPDIIAIKKKITLPALDLNKINDPSYMGYYQVVREKIKHAAYQNYLGSETGEVYISFTVSSLGDLKETRLVEEKSCPSAYLREIALRSIKNALPFPNFPKELNDPQLSFNVVISFETE